MLEKMRKKIKEMFLNRYRKQICKNNEKKDENVIVRHCTDPLGRTYTAFAIFSSEDLVLGSEKNEVQ